MREAETSPNPQAITGTVRDQRTARPNGRRALWRESQAGRMARAGA